MRNGSRLEHYLAVKMKFLAVQIAHFSNKLRFTLRYGSRLRFVLKKICIKIIAERFALLK